ncbi:MAG: hypothetical protein MRZ79_19560 [Bacteroidia bacterium]|nr:hypothetical protein [Bacteroidia bacterium]
MKINILDENFAGKILHEISLEINKDSYLLREIIDMRVREEVKRYNESLPKYFHGLVKPTDAEATLNGYSIDGKRKIDAEKQVYVALNAFKRNAFFVLVDNKQVTDLDEEIDLLSERRISFVRLTPLVGG